MKKNWIAAFLILSLAGCSKNGSNNDDTVYGIHGSQEISFVTADSVTVYGDLFENKNSKATLLLFHQGGSNARAEYGPIIPKLKEEGYNILAIDQRMGGQTYGSYNRTIVKEYSHKELSYCDAYLDLEGALEFITSRNANESVIVWGSSYSGSLAIQLAHRNQNKVAAVLAFSPASGGPMATCRPDPFLEKLSIPLLVLRPSSELQIESAKAQFKLVEKAGHQVYKAQNGTHGSSMLVPERVEGNIDKNWEKVISFINSVIKK